MSLLLLFGCKPRKTASARPHLRRLLSVPEARGGSELGAFSESGGGTALPASFTAMSSASFSSAQ